KPQSLSFSAWRAKVDGGEVKTATIDTAGKVTGQLNDKDNTHYESRIPTALNDNTLAGELAQHKVDVKGVTRGTTVLGVRVGLWPLVVFFALYVWIIRRSSRQLAGGFMGIGSSRAKVYDAERPKTRFTDVAGYEAAKQEISEVVDFLKEPERYASVGAV